MYIIIIIFIFVTVHTTIKKNINNNSNNNNNNLAEKKKKNNEGEREDANRTHGHLVELPPNVRQFYVNYYKKTKKNIILIFSSLNHHVFCFLKNCKIYRFI